MKILVIGGGGREHALVWKLNQSAHVEKIFCAPGNPGISEMAECVPIAVNQVDQLTEYAESQKINLTVHWPGRVHQSDSKPDDAPLSGHCFSGRHGST